MALGKMYAIKPPLKFTEGRDWDRILTTTVDLTPLSQSRLLDFLDIGGFQMGLKGT